MDVEDFGQQLPELRTPPPGPRSRASAERLAEVESRNVTYVADDWPVFWADALGSNVRDVDGNVFLDLTSAFGVAFLGHRPPVLEAALREETLVHGMGDIHPPQRKLELLERLASIAPFDGAKTILANTGSEAVEAALKTASLATGRPGVIAFEGGYHGLTLGSLSATEREHFRGPFRAATYAGVSFLPFPSTDDADALVRFDRALAGGAPNGDAIGAVLIEPVQARGGVRLPPSELMAEIGARARAAGALVVADEIFTGLGRCGDWFASPTVGLTPDIVCIGKTLGAGLPISACLAPARVMDAWPTSTGEAVHTSTFLGHPLACGAALRSLETIEREGLASRAAEMGRAWVEALRSAIGDRPSVREIRGLGLLIGIEFQRPDGSGDGLGASVARRLLSRGLIVLPAGDRGEVLELSPAVTITKDQTDFAVEAIADVVRELD